MSCGPDACIGSSGERLGLSVRSDTARAAQSPGAKAAAPVSAKVSELPPTPDAVQSPREMPRSIGQSTCGSLRAAVPLPVSGPGYRYDPQKSRAHRFALPSVIRLLERAAREAQQRVPDQERLVGELSREAGGPLDGHASHQNGRDLDLRFVLRDASARPYPAKQIPLDEQGRGHDYRDLARAEDDLPVRLDAAAEWAFFEALLQPRETEAVVQRIFIAQHLEAWLLAQAASLPWLSSETIASFARLSCQPKAPHDDHVHLRFHCPVDSYFSEPACEDRPPLAPRQRARLEGRALPQHALRRCGQAKRVSAASARARAGALHPKVQRFLRERRRRNERGRRATDGCS